jgi:SOS response regulatory protein OraA/RecX
MDLAAITDTVEALISVYKFIVTPESERRDTLIKLWHNVTKAISNLTGIPISNFSRFQHTLGSLIGSVFNDPWLDYLLASRYYNADGFDNAQVKKKFRSILTDALNNGDYEGYARVKNELLSKGFSTSEIEKAISNSDVFYEAFNKGPEAFRAEVNAAQKYDPSISSTSVMSAIKSRKTGLVSDLYDAAKVGDKKAMQAVRDELLQLRDVDTKRLLTDKDIDRLLQEKYEKQLKSDIKERLVDLYGTEVYETIKRVILSEYRKFGVTSEEIDRIARSLR